MFRDTCANCHGPDGDEVAGIDLGRGVFRRAKTDQDLVQIIRNGIPGHGDARQQFFRRAGRADCRLPALGGRGQAQRRVRPRRHRSRPAVFEGKGACATCHRVNATGARLGPDLSNIGQLRRAVELEAFDRHPSAEILATNRTYRVVLEGRHDDDGTAAESGQLHGADARHEGATAIVREVDAARATGSSTQSPMPSYKDKLNAQELADVVSYLVSLKGRVDSMSSPRDGCAAVCRRFSRRGRRAGAGTAGDVRSAAARRQGAAELAQLFRVRCSTSASARSRRSPRPT